MGKRKIGFKKAHSKVDALENAASSDEEAIENHLQSILEDEIDQYTNSKEQALLDKASKKSKGKGKKARGGPAGSDEEEEVYNLGLSSSDEDDDPVKRKGADFLHETSEEEDDDDDDNDEDILGRSDEAFGVPDSRAWGKKARVFHNTDYVDQDFGGFEGSDAEMAEQEEAEAKEIQKRLTAELDESDFLGLIPAKVDKKPKKTDKSKEILKVDFDSLSIEDKRKLVQRECPEVIHMIDEYKEKLKEAKILKELMVEESVEFLKSFYQSKYHSLLNYCINISYYLYLRATSPSNCKGHPVIKRILQFRRLLDELGQFNPSKYHPATSLKSILKKKKSLSKKLKKSKDGEMDVEMGQAMEIAKAGDADELEEFEGHEKRKITYAISKNKGLTPKRKREQRNPRVKHREKYRKAKIRRRGQVRTATTEVHRYGGEASGIKSHVTKSIKIK